MFQQTISEKIKNVNLLQKEDLHLFAELKSKYPYAEIFQLIHLQLVKKYDSISFEEELGNSAYKIRDRQKLIDIFEESVIELEGETVTEPVEEDIKVVSISEKIDESIIIEEIQPEEEEDKIIEETEEKSELDSSSLNTQIAAEAFSVIFSKDFEPTIQYSLEDEALEENIENTKVQDAIEVQPSVKEETNNETSHKSFTSWLKSSKKEEKLDKNQLIDTIIATNPTISRPKKEFYSPSKQAIKSVDDEQLVYTETLAKILEMQGNFSKAISAYEQLSLTIPEKKTFFVQKIKELNEKLNTK